MDKKIKENWSAIEEIENQVRKKTGDPEARFNASSFWIGEDGRHLMIPCDYRSKKGGRFSVKHKEMMVYARFCPFTGKPLYEDSLASVGRNDEQTGALIAEIKRRQEVIISEPDGMVRETMIANLLIDLC